MVEMEGELGLDHRVAIQCGCILLWHRCCLSNWEGSILCILENATEEAVLIWMIL